MKRWTILGALICVTAVTARCTSETAPPPEPEMDEQAEAAAIRTVADRVHGTLNERDWPAHGALYTDPYERWEDSRDRATHERGHAENFGGQSSVNYALDEEIALVFVAPDVAIHKTRTSMSGLVDADGNALPTERFIAARVYVKKNGQWLVTATLQTPVDDPQ